MFSESELPHSIMAEVVYWLLTNLTSAACAIRRSRLGSGCVGLFIFG